MFIDVIIHIRLLKTKDFAFSLLHQKERCVWFDTLFSLLGSHSNFFFGRLSKNKENCMHFYITIFLKHTENKRYFQVSF